MDAPTSAVSYIDGASVLARYKHLDRKKSRHFTESYLNMIHKCIIVFAFDMNSKRGSISSLYSEIQETSQTIRSRVISKQRKKEIAMAMTSGEPEL